MLTQLSLPLPSGDAAPINLTAIYVSNHDVIVTWLLPPLSVFTNYYGYPVTLTNFILFYNRIGSTLGGSQVIPFSLSQYQGNPLFNATANLTGISPNEQYTLSLSLTSSYLVPTLSSTAAMLTVNIATAIPGIVCWETFIGPSPLASPGGCIRGQHYTPVCV